MIPDPDVTVTVLGLAFLFALPVLLRLLIGRAGREQEWRWPTDGAVALVATAITTILLVCTAGTALLYGPYTASDFGEYCELVDAVLGERRPVSLHRSLLPAWLLAPGVESLGVFDGFVLGAAAGAMGIAMGVYLWAYAIAGRTAALCALVFLLGCTPVAIFARTLSFYPSIVAITAVASGATAMALRTGGSGWIWTAGACVAAAPLFDVRNVLWIPTCGPLVMLAAAGVGTGSAGARVARWVAFPLLLAASWHIGRYVASSDIGGSLEQQVLVFANDMRRLSGVTPPLRACPGDGLTWGVSDLRVLPDTARCLSKIQAEIPSYELRRFHDGDRWARVGAPWMPIVGLALVVSVLGMSGRRLFTQRGFLALVGPAVPFAMMAMSAMQDPNVRRIGAILVPAPVLLGVAWAVLFEADATSAVGRLLHRLDRARRNIRRMPVVGFAIGSAVAVLSGLPYTALAPSAPARAPVPADTEWAALVHGALPSRAQDVRCAARLAADRARGVPSLGRAGAWFWGDFPVTPLQPLDPAEAAAQDAVPPRGSEQAAPVPVGAPWAKRAPGTPPQAVVKDEEPRVVGE
jgi:hypothetical protein